MNYSIIKLASINLDNDLKITIIVPLTCTKHFYRFENRHRLYWKLCPQENGKMVTKWHEMVSEHLASIADFPSL